jgi:hypothetical protein
LLYDLPNLIECNACVDDRGRDITNDLTHLTSLSCLKRFKYEGVMPPMFLRRLILKINEHIEELLIATQDYQWPFQVFDGFASDFFDLLVDLRIFHFYIRLITSNIAKNFSAHATDIKHLLDKRYCHNIAWVLSKDVGQIFSIPYAFEQFEIFADEFFNEIHVLDTNTDASIRDDKFWHNVQHLTLHINIYDCSLLKFIEDKFTRLRSIDYRVPHFSLVPQDHELQQYDVQLCKHLSTIRRFSHVNS